MADLLAAGSEITLSMFITIITLIVTIFTLGILSTAKNPRPGTSAILAGAALFGLAHIFYSFFPASQNPEYELVHNGLVLGAMAFIAYGACQINSSRNGNNHMPCLRPHRDEGARTQ